MRRALFGLLVVLVAADLDAAIRYRLASETRSSRGGSTETVEVAVDGERWRFERDGALSIRQPFHVLLGSRDRIVALDLERQAWFVPERPDAFRRMTAWDIPGSSADARVTDLEVKTFPVEPDLVAEREVERHPVHVTYFLTKDFGGTAVEANVSAIVTLWVAPDLPAVPAPLDLRRIDSGIAAVDSALEEHLAAIEGFVMKREIGITRRIVGGGPSIEAAIVTVESVEIVDDIPAKLLEVPQGWPEEPPQIATPGMS